MRSERGLSTIQHCLQWYKLVLRTRLSTAAVQYPIRPPLLLGLALSSLAMSASPFTCIRCTDCYTKREAEECESASSDNRWFNDTCYNTASNTPDCLVPTLTTSDPSAVNCVPLNWLLEQIAQQTSATEEYFKSVFQLGWLHGEGSQ